MPDEYPVMGRNCCLMQQSQITICRLSCSLIFKEVSIVKEISKAKTTVESYAKEKNMGSASCDHIKCKLCEY